MMRRILMVLILSVFFWQTNRNIAVASEFLLSEQHLKRANILRRFTASLLSGVNETSEKIPGRIKKTLVKYPDVIFMMLQSARRQEFLQTVKNAQIPVDLSGLSGTLVSHIESILSSPGLPLFTSARNELVRACDLWVFLKESDRKVILNRVPDRVYLSLAESIRQNVNSYDYSQEDVLQEFKDRDTGLDTSGVPDAFVNLFHVMIDEYFNQYPISDKIKILHAILRLPLPVSDIDKVTCFLNASGPVVQKFFQLMGNKVQSPVYKKVVNKLKDEIQPFPFTKVKIILEKTYKKPLDQMFSYLNPEPLAAATIAQVHLGKLAGTDETVVVKIRRPGLKKRVKKELAILNSLVRDPGISKILNGLKEVIHEELDFRREASWLKKGRKYHYPARGIHVVRIRKELPPKESVLVMELAKGKSISKFMQESDLIKKSRGLKSLYELWLNEALFGSGFFHADLHTGNVFYSPSDVKPGYQLTLIDFGSVGTLNFSERKALIQLGLGIYIQKAELIMAGFRPFEDMTCREAKKFYSTVKNIVSENQDSYQQTNLIINEAIKRQFDISKNYLQFNRGKVFIEEHINHNNKMLEEAGLSKYTTSPTRIYVNVLLRKLPRLVKNLVFKKEDKNRSIIDRFTMKAAWKYVATTYLNRKMKILPFDVCLGRRKV